MIRIQLAILAFAFLVPGCTGGAGEDGQSHGHSHDDGWSVTAWGEHFEIFAEADPLIVGGGSVAHTHVTLLDDFSAMTDGAVSLVLVAPDGTESAFRQRTILRPGIFNITMVLGTEGEFELRFRVESGGLTEEIVAGRVRIGRADDPGGLIAVSDRDPAVGDVAQDAPEQQRDSHSGRVRGSRRSVPDAEVISFLKEQQWEALFYTAWTEDGAVRRVVSGTGRVRPVAGWEAALTASLDGEVAAIQWPYVGLAVESGTVVFQLVPRAGEGRSLAELEALETEKGADLELARERLERLEALIEVQATSRAEVEAARARVKSMTAQHDAAQRNLQAVRHDGGSTSGRGRVDIVAPISGRIAAVSVGPGEAVSAGTTLARVVQTEPFWVEVYLHPAESALLTGEAQGLLLRGPGMTESIRFEPSRVRLVSRAPVVNDRTGAVTCIFEIDGSEPRLPLGTAVEADVMLTVAETGVVVPSSAVVDDAGVPVVYIQIEGEGFVRQEIRIRAREGDRLLVDGLEDGERVVTVGGATIRRAALVSTDLGHGHVH